jgi:predicted DNA-binding transcriptional regulator AlpA
MAARRVLLQEDLHPEKGIPWDRSSIWRKVKNGTFPPPDGKTTDSQAGKNFWYEVTIDRYLRDRVKKTQAARQAAAQTGD